MTAVTQPQVWNLLWSKQLKQRKRWDEFLYPWAERELMYDINNFPKKISHRYSTLMAISHLQLKQKIFFQSNHCWKHFPWKNMQLYKSGCKYGWKTLTVCEGHVQSVFRWKFQNITIETLPSKHCIVHPFQSTTYRSVKCVF